MNLHHWMHRNCSGMLILFLLLISVAAGQSPRTVTGKVLSGEDRSPVAGASVSVEGTMNGTSTATDGTFRLIIPVGETVSLMISSIGFDRIRLMVRQDEPGPFVVLLHPTAVEGEMVVTTASKRPQSL